MVQYQDGQNNNILLKTINEAKTKLMMKIQPTRKNDGFWFAF